MRNKVFWSLKVVHCVSLKSLYHHRLSELRGLEQGRPEKRAGPWGRRHHWPANPLQAGEGEVRHIPSVGLLPRHGASRLTEVPPCCPPWTRRREPHVLRVYPQVNMIVLGKNLGIPKPFGPRVNGRCALEAEMSSLMEGLGLNCTFIDNFKSYHKLLGEVHCGSNVRRKPFDFKWWNLNM